MEVKVKLSNLRIAPRKTRLVADLVRGKNLAEAQSILSFTVNKTARNILKLLNSAEATAIHDLHLDKTNLFVSKIMVDEGPKLKRWHPMSRGRAYPIIKRTSQIVLVLGEINSMKETVKKDKKEERIKKTAKIKKPRTIKTVKTKK
jgi:large subunit ribosomal protein L22